MKDGSAPFKNKKCEERMSTSCHTILIVIGACFGFGIPRSEDLFVVPDDAHRRPHS